MTITTKEDPVTACRECHCEGEHKLSCSHVRYEGRIAIRPEDEVALPHEPTQPYCPGPTIACYHTGYADVVCQYTGADCYYAPDGGA